MIYIQNRLNGGVFQFYFDKKCSLEIYLQIPGATHLPCPHPFTQTGSSQFFPDQPSWKNWFLHKRHIEGMLWLIMKKVSEEKHRVSMYIYSEDRVHSSFIYSTRYTHVWYTVQCNTPYCVLGTWYNIPSIF